MAAVQMPDGQTVEMPDQLDPQLGARLRAFHDSQVTANPGIVDIAKGVGDAALSGAAKLSTGIVGAPVALANRLIAALSGGDPQEAADAAHDYVNSHFGYDTTTPVGKKIGAAVSGALAPIGQSAQADANLITQGAQKLGIPPEETHGAMSELGDIAGTVGALSPVLSGARASTEAATLAAQNAPAAVTKYGMRTLTSHPIAAGAAGPSGTQAVLLHNQPLGNTVLGAEAGVPHGHALVPGENGSLAQARTAPGSVYDRLQESLPTAPLSSNATRMMQSAGTTENVLTAPSEATQAAIDAQRARLQGPLTGPQVVQTSRALRQEGGARLGSDDVEQQNLGSAQLQIARALEQHIADTLQPNAPVSLEQFQAARTALAKNYAVQGAVKGGNVDMQAIGRMQLRDPDLLTGPMADIADFANKHPSVTSLPNRIEVPPSFANDLGKAIGTGNHQGVLDRLFGASGIQAGARRILTGNPGAATEAAQQTPVTGLSGEFGPLAPRQPPPLDLQPPSGQAFTPHQPEAATGNPQQDFFGTGANNFTANAPTTPAPPTAGPPGQIPLADVLSHGVEQPPAAGLQSAPMGAPPQTGIPFQRNAAHEAGDLTLDELLNGPPRTYTGNNADLPGVMSQGVPEGTMTRTSAPGGVSKVAHSPAFINQNASLGNPASLEGVSAKNQALAKDVQPVSFGADDQEHPMSPHDIERRDLNPAPGSIFIDKKTGQVINSGGMAPRLVQGLLARWQALHGGGLGEAF